MLTKLTLLILKEKKFVIFQRIIYTLLVIVLLFEEKCKLNDLQKYLHSLPDQPNAIPYITSYYERKWGFCLTQKQRDDLIEGQDEVMIDSKIFKGQLNYGELILPGKSDKSF